MINFVIIDKNISFQKIIKTIIFKIMNNLNQEYKIYFYKEINQIPQLEEQPKIYILDIDSLGLEAFEFAKKIRKYDFQSFIFLNTNYSSKFFQKIYRELIMISGVIDYENNYRVLYDFLSLIVKKLSNNCLKIKSNNILYKINLDKILYITKEKDNHRILIVTDNNHYSIFSTLKDIFNSLDDRFIYSHRACIVNTDRIIFVDKNMRTITFDNNIEINLLSFRSIKDIQNKFKNQL